MVGYLDGLAIRDRFLLNNVGVWRGCGCVQGVKLIVVREGQGKVEVKL